MRLVLFGPPGAGKGTQAKFMAEEFALDRISTGDLLREAVRRKNPLGLKVDAIMREGRLVDDATMIAIVKEHLSQQSHAAPDRKINFVLDGFPRNPEQAQALDRLLEELGMPLECALEIHIPLPMIINRLSLRRTCPACERVYHLEHNPPRETNTCSGCGASLLQRADDQEEIIRKRYQVYQEQTAPLKNYYAKKGILIEIDGTAPIPDVHRYIAEKLKQLKESVR